MKTGQQLETNANKTEDKYLLQELVKKLRKKVKDLIISIEHVKVSAEYKAIIEIEDWSVYFEGLRIQLQQQLNELEHE